MNEDFLYSEEVASVDENGDAITLYTNTVAAEDLNNIALDIGHPNFSYFSDEDTYAVDELNEITKALVTKGVLYGGRRCSLSYDKENERIVVGSGICVFDNGAKVRVENMLTIDYIPGGKNYVYFLNDTANNKISLCNNLVKPTDGDFVSIGIAYTDSEGNVLTSNVRTLSCANYTNMGGRNTTYTYKATGDNALKFPANTEKPYKTTISFQTEGFNFVSVYAGGVYRAVRLTTTDGDGNIIDNSDGVETDLRTLSDGLLASSHNDYNFKFVKNGSEVEITTWGDYNGSAAQELTLYFF